MQWVSGGCGWCQRNKKIVYVAHSNHMDWIALLSMPLFLANGLTCVWGICWNMFINWAYSNMYGNNCAVSGTIITSSNGEVIICLWFKIQCIWKCIKHVRGLAWVLFSESLAQLFIGVSLTVYLNSSCCCYRKVTSAWRLTEWVRNCVRWISICATKTCKNCIRKGSHCNEKQSTVTGYIGLYIGNKDYCINAENS